MNPSPKEAPAAPFLKAAATPPHVVGKTPWLTLHVSAPLQSETPLALLREHRITPKALLYVRNNQDLAGSFTAEAATGPWRLELSGTSSAPSTLEVAELERYPFVETEMVLQCSGNSRGQYGRASPVSGAQWQDGAVANVIFGGVQLKDVLDPLGIPEGARYLTARGAGDAHEPDLPPFERSVPLEDVLETALLATTLNGEPLPAVHGGPVRLVLPGYFGVNNVKWLTHLRLACKPTDNLYQTGRYRLPLAPLAPGEAFEPTLENSRPSWRMSVKSLLWQPLVGESQRAGPIALGGVAWTDGRSTVAFVEVSCDQGKSWQRAELESATSPYAWRPWSLTLTLAAGEHELWVRAGDSAGNVQPLDGAGWNPAGYEFSGVQRVRLSVR
jgi:sulfite oxidase